MAHFAKLDQDNIVIAVHVVDNDVITINGEESEQAGIDFLTNLHGHSNWKQTSYNATFRGSYAGIGFKYDQSIDTFLPPKPYASWVLNPSTKLWEAPYLRPTDGAFYHWDETTTSWVKE